MNLKTIYETIYNRSEMPQVSGEDLGDAYKLMKKNNIPVEIVYEYPKTIKFSQRQINKDKVKNIIADLKDGKVMPPVVISSDKWMVDGHHRNVGNGIHKEDEKQKMIKIGLPRDKAIEIYKQIEGKI